MADVAVEVQLPHEHARLSWDRMIPSIEGGTGWILGQTSAGSSARLVRNVGVGAEYAVTSKVSIGAEVDHAWIIGEDVFGDRLTVGAWRPEATATLRPLGPVELRAVIEAPPWYTPHPREFTPTLHVHAHVRIEVGLALGPVVPYVEMSELGFHQELGVGLRVRRLVSGEDSGGTESAHGDLQASAWFGGSWDGVNIVHWVPHNRAVASGDISLGLAHTWRSNVRVAVDLGVTTSLKRTTYQQLVATRPGAGVVREELAGSRLGVSIDAPIAGPYFVGSGLDVNLTARYRQTYIDGTGPLGLGFGVSHCTPAYCAPYVHPTVFVGRAIAPQSDAALWFGRTGAGIRWTVRHRLRANRS